jgi:hypothetical protein
VAIVLTFTDDAVVAPAGGGVSQIGKGRSAGPLAS